MGVRYPMHKAAAVFVGTASLSLLIAGGVRAQTSQDKGAPPAVDAPKSDDAKKAEEAARASEKEMFDRLKDVNITLNADHENLIETLRSLMKAAKVDFAIDSELKEGTATVHFKDLPFKDALTTLVKVSTIPIKYEIKNGVFHFMRRPEPPVEEKPEEPAAPKRPRFETGKFPLGQIGSDAALRKLTGPFNSPPQIIYQHSNQPGFHGQTSSSGFGGLGYQSSGVRYNPDGSVTRTGSPPINILGLLRGLLGGLR